MNIELIRLKKKLAIMEIEGSNQLLMDLLKLVGNPVISINIKNIELLKKYYNRELQKLEEKDSKYIQTKML